MKNLNSGRSVIRSQGWHKQSVCVAIQEENRSALENPHHDKLLEWVVKMSLDLGTIKTHINYINCVV